MSGFGGIARGGLVACLTALWSVSCGGDSTSPTTPKPTGPSTTIAPFTLRDTIQVAIAAPMIITVRDSLGNPVVRTDVAVTVAYLNRANTPFDAAAFFAVTPQQFGAASLLTKSDTLGRVHVWVRLGTVAAAVRIRVASSVGRDSVDGVILPGQAHHFGISNRDTALYVGASFTPTITPQDRVNNATADAVTTTARQPAILDVSPGSAPTLSARATGRGYVVATAGVARDSVAVSVVPRGNLIAYSHRYSGDQVAFVMFGLDGSGYHAITPNGGGYNTRAPRWNETLQRLVYHEHVATPDNPYAISLFSATLTGAPQLVLSPNVVAVGASAAKEYASATQPSVTRDGAWIYFSATVGYNETGIWRVHPDGTGASRVGPATGIGTNDTQPSVAPDGHRVVYITDRGNFASGATRLMLLDANTGVSLSMATLGTRPSWSPVADEIAFFAKGLSIVRPDGTGETVLANGQPFDTYNGTIEWSPDGKWIVACVTGSTSGDRKIVLIERATGVVLPLAFTATDQLCEATWKP